MSWCRFSDGDSDVYVFENTEDEIECYGCSFASDDPFEMAFTVPRSLPEAMFQHLMEHRERGDKVPLETIERAERLIRET